MKKQLRNVTSPPKVILLEIGGDWNGIQADYTV